MSLYFEYGRSAVTLPQISKSLLARADKVELQLLLALTSDPALMADYEAHADALAAALETTRSTLDGALCFWIGAGVICREKAAAKAVADFEETVIITKKQKEAEPVISVPRRAAASDLPHYTNDEFTAILEKRSELTGLLDEAQNAFGKTFNMTESRQLISIIEGLGLDAEYILTLLAYCRNKGKNSLRYVEKTAVSLYDMDITTPETLAEHLRSLELAESAEGQIRRLFGIGTRSFTAKEKGYIADWVVKFGFGEDMLEKAYEFAADATANPTLGYVNSILLRWHEEKINTPEDADRDRENHRAAAEKKSRKPQDNKKEPTATSFDVDDFFEAALKRGLRD